MPKPNSKLHIPGYLNVSEYSRKHNIPLRTLQYRIKNNLILPQFITHVNVQLPFLKDDHNIFINIKPRNTKS